jgi:hypothetical protein
MLKTFLIFNDSIEKRQKDERDDNKKEAPSRLPETVVTHDEGPQVCFPRSLSPATDSDQTSLVLRCDVFSIATEALSKLVMIKMLLNS